MVKVKICGLSSKEHALAAYHAGADYLGFVFAESKRRVSPQQALGIIKEVRKFKDAPKMVGVFVNLEASEVNEIAAYLDLDFVQLSGDEDISEIEKIAYPVLKTIHVSLGDMVESLRSKVNMLRNCGGEIIPLLDTAVKGHYGGTGKRFDWQLAKEFCKESKAIIAGGLNPQNVGEAVKKVNPWGVDVSGGVETGGVKDTSLIESFIEEARKAYKELEA